MTLKELSDLQKAADAIPYWKKVVLERARKVEMGLGFIPQEYSKRL